MKIINQFLQEKTISYGTINYSKENLKKLRQKRYESNGYYWFYIGKTPGGLNSNRLPYVEQQEHVYVWNLYHPNDKVFPDTSYLIHHRNENKKDNRIQNLIKTDIVQHNKDHLTKRRKEMPRKFNKRTSALGGKHSH